MAKFFDYFPLPRFLEFPYVGINITPRAIRFIEIVREKGSFRVGRFAEKPVNSRNPDIGVQDDKELVSALENLRKEYNLKFIEAALPEEKTYIFKINVPNQEDDQIRTFIEFHLEENVPLSLEEAIFDYYLVADKNSSKPTIEATVSVLPAKVVREYLEVFNKAGLVPISFLIESQAIAKAIIKKGDLNTYLIVNIGDNKTVLSIVSYEAVEFTSTLMIGADDFTTALVKQFNVTTEVAKKMKREKGFIKNKENNELFFAMISTASALKDEIERVYIYWHTHLENRKSVEGRINKILLIGKDAATIGFREYIAESIRVETEIANVWTNTFSFSDYIPPIEKEEALNYGAVIGLALPKL